MWKLILLLLNLTVSYAEIHSLQYIYTSSSGISSFPQTVIVGMVDDGQIIYYDSNTHQAVPKKDWVNSAADPQYWERNTGNFLGFEQTSKVNLNTLKERFNHSEGVHTFQFMYGCEMEDDGSTRGHYQFGYDGEDFISFDKNTLTWTATKSQAVITKNKWEAGKAQNEYRKGYLEKECIEWLKKYVGYGKDSLERKDAPEVFMLQKDPASPVVCQATGFYPSNIMITWQKNKEEHFEDVDVGAILTNADGTFQKTVTLSVKPEEWKNNKEAYRCVVQHVGAKDDIIVTVKDIRSNGGSDNTIAIIVGCVAAVAVLAAIAGLIYWRRSNGYGRASSKDTDSEQSDPPTAVQGK